MPFILSGALVSLGVSASIAGPISSLLFTGLSLILSILFAPEVPTPEAGRNPIKQSIPNRVRIIGRRRNGGAYMLYHSHRGSTVHAVQAICEGEVSEFSAFYLHDDKITLLGNVVQGVESHEGSFRYGDSKVHIYWRYGEDTETAYTPSNAFPFKQDLVDDDVWGTEDFRGDGIASTCALYSDAGPDNQAQRFPFGIPQLSAEVRATKVFDPRLRRGDAGSSPGGTGAGSNITGGSAGGQEWQHPSTWSFANNENPILQAMWFLTAPIEQGGMALDFEECFSNVLDDVAAQADICDEQVPNKGGGSENRYRSGALYEFDDDPSDVLAAILGTCDGFCCERGDGSFELKAGKWDDDDFAITVTDRHIISLIVRRFRPDEDDVTGIIVQYNSVVHEHQTIDAPVWPRDAYMGGNDHRIRSIKVDYCPAGRQAQRLSKRVATYEMATVTGTIVLNMYGVLLLDRRGVTIQCSDDPALADCKARITRLEPDLVKGTVTLDFQVFDPVECDAWDPATEEGPLQPVVVSPIDDARSVPTNLIAAAAMKSASKTWVNLEFDPGESRPEYFDVRQRVADTGGGVPGPWQTVGRFSGSAVEEPEEQRWIVTITNPIIESSVEIQIKGPSSPAWSQSAFVDTENPGPLRVEALTAVLSGSDVDIDWTAPTSSNFDHARVYRAAHDAGFGLATDISGPIAGSPSSAMNFTDTAPGTGHYDYYVTAETAANLASLARGPEDVSVP